MHPGIKADQAYLAHALSSAHRSVIPSIDLKVVKAGATGAHKLISSLYSIRFFLVIIEVNLIVFMQLIIIIQLVVHYGLLQQNPDHVM